MCVLVLDDNQTSRFAICAVLERAGYQCLEAETAEQAQRAVREQRIDLLIADAILRGEHGPEIARRLRGELPGIPVLFISGYPLDHLAGRGILEEEELARGAAAFLQKPFRAESLVGTVRSLLEQRAQGGAGT